MADSSEIPLTEEDMNGNNDRRDTQEAGHAALLEPSIFFCGPIPEAIEVAKSGKKILVVYIAGMDENSLKLNQITWKDTKILENLSEQYVVLRLLEGSQDALHFSALYPFQSIPTITLLGYNGLLLGQHEGYISPAEFLVSLQQAGDALEFQNAAASAVAAALSSATLLSPNPTVSGSQQSPSATNEASDLLQGEPSSSLPSSCCSKIPESPSVDEDDAHTAEALQSSNENFGQLEVHPSSSVGFPDPLEQSCVCALPEAAGIENNAATLQDVMAEGFRSLPLETTQSSVAETVDPYGTGEPDSRDTFQVKQDMKEPVKKVAGTVLLQIRLTNAESIRGEFQSGDSLAVVKDFVDNNRTDGKIDYFLAIPYPRKVFSDEDMQKTLLALQLEARATLLLVPKKSIPKDVQPTVSERRSVASTSSEGEGPASGGFLWKIFSYFNPFSYFGGNAPNRDAPSRNSSWQYDPNPALERSLREGLPQQEDTRGFSVPNNSPLDQPRGESSGRSSKSVQKDGWGGNIHTLQHDEDERLGRGNAYWNGNSTQFGGDDSKNS